MTVFFAQRVLLVTGKGGVGKSAVAASLALAASRMGKRALVAEIGEPDEDPSAVGRYFGRQTLPAEPVALARNVDGVMLWARRGHERFLQVVLPIPALVRAGLRSKALRRLLDAAPSLNELGVFYHMLTLARNTGAETDQRWDVLIVDLPATGHALGMAALPDRLLSVIPSGPISRALQEGKELFFDSEQAAMWVVTLPETLPVTECLELLEGLDEEGMPIGGVVVNKVLPTDFTPEEHTAILPMIEEHELFGETRFHGIAQVEKALATVEAEAGVPVVRVPEHPFEGGPLIGAMADDLRGIEEGS